MRFDRSNPRQLQPRRRPLCVSTPRAPAVTDQPDVARRPADRVPLPTWAVEPRLQTPASPGGLPKPSLKAFLPPAVGKDGLLQQPGRGGGPFGASGGLCGQGGARGVRKRSAPRPKATGGYSDQFVSALPRETNPLARPWPRGRRHWGWLNLPRPLARPAGHWAMAVGGTEGPGLFSSRRIPKGILARSRAPANWQRGIVLVGQQERTRPLRRPGGLAAPRAAARPPGSQTAPRRSAGDRSAGPGGGPRWG